MNHAEVARIAAYLVDRMGNDGLVVAGTTGESPTLSPEEKLALLDTVLDAVGDRAAVVFGAGTYDTHESARMARESERRGAHGVMVVNPYYSRPGQRGLEAHFRAVAESTSLPVMIYNIAPRSAINLETPTLLRLAEVPNIVAVKEASGNMAQICEVCEGVPSGFRVYSGDDGLTLPVLAVGGHGVVSVAAHVVGDRMRRMLDDVFAGRLDDARRSHEFCLPVIRALFASPSPVPVKHALASLGFATRAVRLPLVELDGPGARDLEVVLEQAGVLPSPKIV